MKQLQIFLFLSLCLFMKSCGESNEPETFESSQVESASPPPSKPPPPPLPPSRGTCSDILYPAPRPPGKPYPTPPTEEECEYMLHCEWSVWPADFYFVNETTMPIRLVYGAYDGSCLPPRLSPDMHIPADDSLKKHLDIGMVAVYYMHPQPDSIFLSRTVMVVFNEERYAFHVRDDRCQFGKNLFCDEHYEPTYPFRELRIHGKASYRYTFTEEDYAQATPFPRDP